jgi:hypothetical protein
MGGVDPIEAADAMLAVCALMAEQHRGIEAAKIALVAGRRLPDRAQRSRTADISNRLGRVFRRGYSRW